MRRGFQLAACRGPLFLSMVMAARQLDLFDFAAEIIPEKNPSDDRDLSDPVRIDGRAPLTAVPAQDGAPTGGAGADDRGNGNPLSLAQGGGIDGIAGGSPGAGVDPREIYSLGVGAGRRQLNAGNFRFDAEANRLVGAGSLKQKARDNFAAIELSQLLDQEARPATDEEKRVLVRHVGWGGIPQVFASWQEPSASDWLEERQTIERLLTPAQYEAARASTLSTHYTAPTVVSAMYETVERLGFTSPSTRRSTSRL